MNAHIHAHAISKIYQATDLARVIAIDDFNLEIQRGEFVCLVGPSGCGKSTFLSMLAGLDRPTSGQLSVGGQIVTGPRREVAVVFQDHSLLPWKTVLDNVGVGLKARGIGRRERDAVARRFLAMAGLNGCESRYPYELSGGMKQRVGIVRALAVEPEVLLMDEPFAALDAQTRTLLQEELLRIYDQFKRTIVFVTHNVSEAVFLADRVVVISFRPGRVKGIVPITFPRPRTLALLDDERFLKTTAQVWGLLKGEAAKAFEAERK